MADRRKTAHTRGSTWSESGAITTSSSRLEINYDRLKQLCARFTPNNRIDHQDFMREYPMIFYSIKKSNTTSMTRTRPHTCFEFREGADPSGRPLHNVGTFLMAIRGSRNEKEKKIIQLGARLRTMTEIIQKLPIQRTREDTKHLAQHLAHFSHLFPLGNVITSTEKTDIFTELAKRAVLESVPSHGFSLPERGGLYLLLQGCVEKITKNPTTKDISSTFLWPGDSFGGIENENQVSQPLKSTYPMFTTAEACILLRIYTFDYHRVVHNVRRATNEEKKHLINSCSLLYAVSPAILQKIIEPLRWEMVPANTIIIREGEAIGKVFFIQEGNCTATVNVPGTPRELHIIVGALGPGDCIGEVLIHSGRERQPFTITTTAPTKLGWVSSSTIKCKQILWVAGFELTIIIDSK